MKTMTTDPKRGDRIYFQYGCMCGDDFGTVVSDRQDSEWGPSWMVRLSDFTTTQIDCVRGTVVADDDYVLESVEIGAYLVEVSS